MGKVININRIDQPPTDSVNADISLTEPRDGILENQARTERQRIEQKAAAFLSRTAAVDQSVEDAFFSADRVRLASRLNLLLLPADAADAADRFPD